MLDEKRIREAEQNVNTYLRESLIKKVSFLDEDILNILKKNSEDSIKIATLLNENNLSPLWVIVCSYYSMYYIANAILYKRGYKIGRKISHKVTSDALIFLIRNKLKLSILEEYEEAKQEASGIARIEDEAKADETADNIIETFDAERIKREQFQYETTEIIKKAKAQTSLERAKRFLLEMEKLMEKK